MITRAEVEEWADRYRRAWEQADAQAAARLFTDDATYRSNIYEPPHEGRDGVTAYWSWVTAAQSRVRVRMGAPLVEGDRADVEFWTTMDVEGSPVTLAGCLLLRFDDSGLCSQLREYWNFVDGSHQPPPEWGS